MSLQSEEKRPKKMDSNVMAALIGATATIAAALITIAMSWQHQPQNDQRKSEAVARRDATPSTSAPEPRPTAEAIVPQPTAKPIAPALTLDRILDMLQDHRQRATFGAVAGVLSQEPKTLFDGYSRTTRTAWVVSKA